jgi:hypothetical protein
MSRYYGMAVELRGYEPARREVIQEAAAVEWPFVDWAEFEGTLRSDAESHLCGGETEEQFTERLSMAVWRANGAYCEVVVNATYLEDLPCEIHCLDEDDYDRLVVNEPPPSRGKKGDDEP